jgi:hypothetical protein
VVHRASDLAGQADTGTATQARARGLLADAETRVLYTQTAGERALLTDLLDLTDVEAQLLTQLPPHRALWQIGRHRAVVDHLLSPLEQTRLVDTDQHMRPAPAPAALPDPAGSPRPGPLGEPVAAAPDDAWDPLGEDLTDLAPPGAGWGVSPHAGRRTS